MAFRIVGETLELKEPGSLERTEGVRGGAGPRSPREFVVRWKNALRAKENKTEGQDETTKVS